jgi:DNA-binding MarR family transcriptional regulator
VTDDLKDRIAGLMLSILPFYHKKIFSQGHAVTGMQAAQYKVLWILTREGILPMSELGKHLSISRPYITTLVDQLIRDGYVERIPDIWDRRVINICITPSGKKNLQQAGVVFKADIKNLLAGLDDNDLKELCQSLEKLHSIFAKIK